MINNIFLRVLVFPLYLMFEAIVWLKNKVFDYKLVNSYLPPVFTISVGNLAVGGTGKTPMVEYLVELLETKTAIAILSRGYGRKTKGFYEAIQLLDSKNIGDEPYQYYLKFGQNINVFVDEKRVNGVKKILEKYPNKKLILLDDAFQHRQIDAHLKLVLTDRNKPVFDDTLMPIGRLREPIHSLKRADIVIVTKCEDDFTESKRAEFCMRLRPFCEISTPIFFSKITYQKPIQFLGEKREITNEVILITGLANADKFVEYCSKNWVIEKHFDFDDHHNYSTVDIAPILKNLSGNSSILMPEKDFVKLKSILSNDVNAYYLPIKTTFLFDQKNEFDTRINDALYQFYQNKINIIS
jgi:tetraacyldisaccharide 4'-kinase